VDDALIVGSLERVGDLAGDGERLVQRKRAAGDARGEVFAVDELHHERGSFQPVDLRDVGMVQGSEGVSLALETPEPVRIAREDFRKDFDRDIAMQLRVARAIDLAHSSGAEGVLDLVRTDAGTGGQGHRRPIIGRVAPRYRPTARPGARLCARSRGARIITPPRGTSGES
jgi:hypothetical protein